METKKYSYLFFIAVLVGIAFNLQAQKKSKNEHITDTLNYSIQANQGNLEISFLKGKSFNHPTFAIWTEDMDGNYIESLFVTQYFATGIYGNADAGDGKWSDEKGESIRPAALPYWSRKRNIESREGLFVPTPEKPVTDAVTGATPKNNFVMTVSPKIKISKKFKVLFEINQTWDWNNYWTNSKYPGNKDYQSSAQPSLIYEAVVDPGNPGNKITFKPIGHGHYSGKDGSLTTDISTLTTALEIANQIVVSLID